MGRGSGIIRNAVVVILCTTYPTFARTQLMHSDSTCCAFQPNPNPRLTPTCNPTSTTALFGRRSSSSSSSFKNIIPTTAIKYENVPLPISLVPTTIFVGNLDDFTTASDLTRFFSVTTSPLAVISRKPNRDPLGYGFVSFPTAQEAQDAVLRGHGSILNGRKLRVEMVRGGVEDGDEWERGQQMVPAALVRYALGDEKPDRRRSKRGGGGGWKQRRDSQLDGGSFNGDSSSVSQSYQQTYTFKTERRLSKRRNNRINNQHAQIENDPNVNAELKRASVRGYVALDGTAYRRGRSRSIIACGHREACIKRGVPQIVLCKASGGRRLDNLIVDLSPLLFKKRTLVVDGTQEVEEVQEGKEKVDDGSMLDMRRDEIMIAAVRAGMVLVPDYEEDNTAVLVTREEGGGNKTLNEIETYHNNYNNNSGGANDGDMPAVGPGVFEGERSQAKEMAKELALLWGTKVEDPGEGCGIIGVSGRRRTVGTQKRRRRSGSKEGSTKNYRRVRRERWV